MKVIILAGGKATRLPQSAKNKPKALVEVGGKPILQHQIDGLVKHGFFDIRLALGYKAEQIIDYLKRRDTCFQTPTLNPCPFENKYPASLGVNIDYVIEPEPLDTGGAIKFASKDLKEPFMVLNGDILSDMKFSNFYKKFEKRPEENLLTAFHIEDSRSYGMIKREKGRVSAFLEKPTELVAGYINAGFYILSPKIFKNIKKKRFSIERDIFPNLAKKEGLSYYVHKGFWTDAGTEERLSEARNFYRKI